MEVSFSCWIIRNFVFSSQINLDFGFAQKLKENSAGNTLKGSPLYMAPERLKSKSYDHKVDLWSVGVILHGTSWEGKGR